MAERTRGSGRINANGSHFFAPTRGWASVVALALTQNGTVDTRQLLACGLSRSTIQRYVAVGWLHRIHHGVYALTPLGLLSRRGRATAAALAGGPGAGISHWAAGDHLGLISSRRARFDVTVPTHAGRRRRPGIQIHRSTTLRPQDIVIVDGVPCTTWARTAVDLADVLTSDRPLERALDRAEELRIYDDRELREQLRHNAGRHRAARRLARILATHAPGSTPTFNDFEEMVFIVVRTHTDLPDPEVQAYVDLGDGGPMIRPDFSWRRFKLMLEADGYATHSRRLNWLSDHRRDVRAQIAGWRVARTDWDQVTGAPAELGAALTALAAATPGLPRAA